MELDRCAVCETEDTEGILVETRQGPAGLCDDCMERLVSALLLRWGCRGSVTHA